MGVAGGDAAAATAGRKRGPGAGTRCELCGGAAAVHCAADSAFLCLRCDAKVHGANFLASRHLRRRLPRPAAAESGASSASSASSCSCVSTADSAESTAAAPAAAPSTPSAGRAPARRPRAEAVLEGWAKRMGFAAGPARRRAATAAAALRALGRGVAAARVPLRVAMAAALWSEVADPAAGCRGNGGDASLALLRRLEAAAHVPARLVLTVASWMARAASRPTTGPAADADADGQDQEEGWAECS